MYSRERYEETRDALKQIRKDFDLDTVFGGNMKACQKACTEQIKLLKAERTKLNSRNESTYLVDAKLRAFSWAYYVLAKSRANVKSGKKPWLNGYYDPYLGGPDSLFF